MEFNIDFGKLFRKFVNYVRPDLPREIPVPVINAYERFQGSVESILAYRSFDEETNLCFLDDGSNPAIGFIFEYVLPEEAWDSWYSWLNDYVCAMPEATTLLFGRLSTPVKEDDLNVLNLNKNNPLMEKLVNLEKQLILETSTGPSLLSKNRLNSRKISAYIAIRIPYQGSPNNIVAINKFTNYVESVYKEFFTKISQLNGDANILSKDALEALLRQLASPMSDPLLEEDFEDSIEVGPFKLFNASYHRYIDSEGHLTYATIDAEGEFSPELNIATLTVDSFPSDLNHLQVQKAIAADISYNSQIVCPYWAYTIIEVISQEERNKSVEVSGGYSKEYKEKPWFYDYYLNELPPSHFEKNQLKFLMGINLYSPPEELDANVETATVAFTNQGFRLVDEVFLGFPLFLSSMPFQYSPKLNQLNRFIYVESSKALQCGYTSEMSSKLKEENIPAFTRSGAICGIPLNSVIGSVFVGKQHTGKSVLMGCVVENQLNADKKVGVLSTDKGFNELIKSWEGGSYSIAKEESGLNFFSLITDEKTLKAHLPVITSLYESVIYLASDVWEDKYYSDIEKSIVTAWTAKTVKTTTEDVYKALKSINPELASHFGKSSTIKNFELLNKPVNLSHKNKNILELRLDTRDGFEFIYSMWASLCLSICSGKGLFVLENADIFEDNDLAGLMYFKSLAESVNNRGIWGLKSFREESAIDQVLFELLNLKKLVFMQEESSIAAAIADKRIKEDNRVVSILRSIRSYSDSFEVAVQSGDIFKVFLVVKHYSQYLLLTSSGLDKEKINKVMAEGYSLEKALIKLSQDYYNNKWGNE